MPVVIGGVGAENERAQKLAAISAKRGRLVADEDIGKNAVGVCFDDRHFVLRQCTGLVRTDDVDRAQCFDRRQFFDNGVDLGHLGHADGQDDGYDGGETLRYGCDGQTDRGQEHFEHVSALEESDAKN